MTNLKAVKPARAILLFIFVHTSLPAQISRHLDAGLKDGLTTSYIMPSRILTVPGCAPGAVTDPEALLGEFNGQVSVSGGRVCTLDNRHGSPASILLDFGREYQGGVELSAAIRESQRPLLVRIRFGESVSEAMSEEGSSATNDHAMRDFVLEVPWLGSVRTGESGFRFVRIDLLDEDAVLPLQGVRLVFRYRDIPYLGSFESGHGRLNDIWQTGAYTVHLNMQNFLWDGIKRDRLVWLGDMHPEVMCVSSVFGDQDVVRRSLDFGRDDTPLPGWMNDMCSYSLWWIIIHRDLYLYCGDKDYLEQQHEYLGRLVRQVIACTDGPRENLSGGVRFLDWPTSEMPEVIHAGLQSMTVMALEAAGQIALWLGDETLQTDCMGTVRRLREYTPDHCGNKQAAALLAMAGLLDPSDAAKVIKRGGAHGFSTFYGYYMLEALAMAGEWEAAMDIVSDYWGAMLDLGATTFWEDLDYGQARDAARIDEFVPEGRFDIHADGGAYCYAGLRHSLCHGWASGPTSWLSRYVLGVEPLEPGMRTVRIRPNLGKLAYAKGTFPTPCGLIRIEHTRLSDGSVHTVCDVPREVTVIGLE